MKFKVGDRVRCTRNIIICKTDNNTHHNTKDKVGIVKEIYSSNFYIIDFDENIKGEEIVDLNIKKGHGLNVCEEDLELIEENTDTKQFTLDDLKVGYLVELRDGSGNMVMEATEGKVLIEEYNGYYLELNAYNNNLNYYGDSYYDIIKVYGFSKYKSKALKFTTEDRELLWERKEILNGKEKEYLTSFIKPFRDRVKYIAKYYDEKAKDYYISIEYENDLDINFPYFAGKEMYKNMETNKKYTLEELEL